MNGRARVPMCARVHRRHCSGVCANNESLAHLDSGPLPLLYGLTCHDGGMTAALSRTGSGRKEGRKGEGGAGGSVVSERIEEEEGG